MTSPDPSPEKKTAVPAWKPGAKVTNASDFGRGDAEERKGRAASSIDPLEILKKKREERLAEEKELDSLSLDPSEKLTPPHFKETKPEPEDADDTGEEDDELAEEEEKESRPSHENRRRGRGFGFYLILALLLILITAVGHLINVQQKEMEKHKDQDPYLVAQKQYEEAYKKHSEAKLKHLQIEQNKLNLDRLNIATKAVVRIKNNLENLERKEESLQTAIKARKGEMTSYFKLYRAATQKQAKGLYLDQLLTRSGRQYQEVTVNRCNDQFISITHAEGATRIPVSELPAPLLDRLAYTNPFDDISTGTTAPAKKANETGLPPWISDDGKSVNATPIRPQSYEPPPGKPRVSAPGKFDHSSSAAPAGNGMSADPELPDDLGLPEIPARYEGM